MKIYHITKPSSQRWLARHFKDPFVIQAKNQGARSRSFFKLKELHEKYSLLKPGMNVLDLGCAPGGWSQFAASLVGPSGAVWGIDQLPMDPLEGVHFWQGHVEDWESDLHFHLILCDMAPSFTGEKDQDRFGMIELLTMAWDRVTRHLLPGGTFVAKIFHLTFEEKWKSFFHQIHYVKPKSSRTASRELYIVCRKFKGHGSH